MSNCNLGGIITPPLPTYIYIYIYHSGSRAPSSERFPRRFRRTMRCVCAECRRCRGTVIGRCCDAPTGARAAPATHLNIKIIIHTQKYVSKHTYIHTFLYMYIFFDVRTRNMKKACCAIDPSAYIHTYVCVCVYVYVHFLRSLPGWT